MEKDIKIPYGKIKELDKFSKNIGLTIYNLDCGFNYNGETYTFIANDFNISPAREKEDKTLIGLSESLKDKIKQ